MHALPSSHAVPSGFGGFVQIFVAGSQAPWVWHASGAGQGGQGLASLASRLASGA